MKRIDICRIGGFLLVAFVFAGCDSGTDSVEDRPDGVIHQLEISVLNQSHNDIFPVIVIGHEESFGVVSAGARKGIGFAPVDLAKRIAIVWSEPDFDSPREEVYFSPKIGPDGFRLCKSLVFNYLGNGEWRFEIYGFPTDEAQAPPRLESIVETAK